MNEQINAKQLLKQHSRRDFLRSFLISAGAGAAAGTGAKYGMDYFLDWGLGGALDEAVRKYRTAVLDFNALYGAVDRSLARQKEQLKKHYDGRVFRMFEELNIADRAELAEFEEIIRNGDELESHYNFSERAKIFRDRIDRLILAVDKKIEQYVPKPLRDVYDVFRGISGKPTSNNGSSYRGEIKQRLDNICRIYDLGEDNKTTQTKVMEIINSYLSQSNNITLTPEEREFYLMLREQCAKENSKSIRDFIKNYDPLDGRNNAYLGCRAYVTKAEELHAKIQGPKKDLKKLQAQQKEIMRQVEKMREDEKKGVPVSQKEITANYTRMANELNAIISDYKKAGYHIQTREDYINSKLPSEFLRSKGAKVTSVVAPLAGFAVFAEIYSRLRKNSKLRAATSAFEDVVERLNSQGGKNES
ncbi:MAG: hypothetical protein QXM31_03400 [Candidatus Woesearchaeota archaeon]